MKKIQYFELLNRAISITIKNKFLWFFGLLIIIGAIGVNLNFNSEFFLKNVNKIQGLSFFGDGHWTVLLALISLFVVIISYFVRTLAFVSSVKSINNLVLYNQISIKAILIEAKKYVGILIFLELLIGSLLLAILFVLALPVAYLFFIKANVFAYIFLAIASIIMLALLILGSFLYRYASYYIILINNKWRVALESAYNVFMRNIKESLIMLLISFGIGIMLIVGIVAVCFLFGILFLPIGIIAKAALNIVIIIAAIFLAIIILGIFSVYEILSQAFWLIFFQEITFEKHLEKNILEKVEIEEGIPNPDMV